ncbi:MAG: outer membrane beta-barrel protein [Gammaproteobacteria bacterium]
MPENTPVTLTSDEARINGDIFPAALRVDVASVNPTASTIFGGRIGHWFGHNFGVAVDASTLNPDVKRQTVTATADLELDESIFGERVKISTGRAVAVNVPRITIRTTATVAAQALVRLPIGATAERPTGWIAPYAFAGPVWLVTDPSLDGNLGLRVGGGAKLPLSRNFALFVEYRYTRVDADMEAGKIGGVRGNMHAETGKIRADLRLRNHSAVGGISVSF